MCQIQSPIIINVLSPVQIEHGSRRQRLMTPKNQDPRSSSNDDLGPLHAGPSRKRRLLATSSSYLALLVVYVLIEVLS
jgi:hypothetical protein